MATIFVIYLKRGGNAPAVTITLESDVDLTGSSVEMVLTPTDGTSPLTLSTDDGEIAITGPKTILWIYPEERPEGLPSGGRTLVDLWRVQGATREAIGSGVVRVLLAGEPLPTTAVSVTVPGIQGARGWAPLFAAVASGDSVVLQVADWTGGGGDKPEIGQYLGPDGMVDDVGEATDIRGATGLTPDISVLSTTTLAPGEPAAVSLDPTSTPEAPKLVFGLPKGDTGLTPDISILPTTTLAPGEPAEVSLGPGSTPEEPRLAFAIPAGVQGLPGAPGEPLVLVVSDTTDIAPGGWWATRDYHGVATFTRLRAEMLAGAAEGVSLYIEKNGLPFAGPFALSSDEPTIVTGLTLVLSPGDNVSAYRVGGTLTGPWLMLLQLDGRA